MNRKTKTLAALAATGVMAVGLFLPLIASAQSFTDPWNNGSGWNNGWGNNWDPSWGNGWGNNWNWNNGWGNNSCHNQFHNWGW